MSSYPRPIRCRVCRFPTLYQKDLYEICAICWWEDDGRGGGDPAIEAAKVQFADHGHMYTPQYAIAVLKNPSAERVALEEYLRSVDFKEKRADVAIWGPLVDAESERSVKAAFPNG